MIPFIAYTLLLLFLVYRYDFFGMFRDEKVSSKKLTLLLAGKIIAVPVFYFVYTHLYGGIEKFDTGKFFNDVSVIANYAKSDPGFYLRLLLGLQDDRPGSQDYINCLQYTVNWDNGTVKDYLYNDNRVVIRIHTIFHFISFGSYYVHALFNCFLSFTGIVFLYKSIKSFFAGKEIYVLFILCFFPALWFYTGALLKEGICLFVMGGLMYQIQQLTSGVFKIRGLIILVGLLFIACLLKPYLLLFCALCFTLFFVIWSSGRIKYKPLVYFSAVVIFVLLANSISLAAKDRSLAEAALQHQQRFEAVSKGGIFLTDSTNYMHLQPDTNQVIRTGKKDYFRIKKGVSYMYWEEGRTSDTLYISYNNDTVSSYRLIYFIPLSGSNIQLNKKNTFTLISSCLYYSLFHPFFFNARHLMHHLASMENLLIIISLLVTVIGLIRNQKDPFITLVFLFFAFSLCVLIGVTAPNSGAIFRYRAPAVVFIILSALYYLDLFVTKHKTPG